jgi:hypothetical protein
MKEARISLPELGLIAGTRGALGFGLGLLLADRWSVEQRRGIGWALFLVGLASTIPLALEVFGRSQEPDRARSQPSPVAVG